MFQKTNFRTKLILSFTGIFLASFLIVTMFFYLYINRYVDQDTRQSMSDLADSISSQLDGEITNLDRIALGVLGNEEFLEGFTQLNNRTARTSSSLTLEKYLFQELLDRLFFMMNTPSLTSPAISVFQPDKDYYFGWNISGLNQSYVEQNLDNISWNETVRQASGARVVIPTRQNEWSQDEDIVFSVARAIMTTKGKFLGIIEVQQKYSVLERICQLDTDTHSVVVLDGSGQLVYPLSLPWEDALSNLNACTDPQGKLSLDGTSYLFSTEVSDYSGWKTLILRPEKEVFRNNLLLFQFVFYAMLIIFIISLVMVFFTSQSLSKPIRKLRASMEHVDIDQLNISLEPEKYNDEIQLFNQAFEKMLERIDLSIKQKVQAQQEEARAYFLALQSQTDPHFLYNTLSTIAVLAGEKGEKEIERTTRYLIDMLRYVGNYDQSQATLSQEIRHARQYLTLLKTRYEDTFTFQIQTEGDTESLLVPKLILQPLAENSYKHGLSSISPPWEIRIFVKIEETRAILEVSDNGSGFSEETLKEFEQRTSSFRISDNLLADIKGLNLNNVGLFNTYSRLYLKYNGRASLSITNQQPHGAKVTIILPNDEEDKKHKEDTE